MDSHEPQEQGSATTRAAEPAAVGIFVILIFFVLHVAGDFFAPMLAAVVFGLLLSPLCDKLERRGVPSALAAAILLIATLAALSMAIFGLILPLTSWVERAPLLWYKFRTIIEALEEPLRDLSELREITRAIFGDDAAIVVTASGDDEVTQVVSAAPVLAGQILIFIGAFYFYLAGRRDLKRALIGFRSRRRNQLKIARLIAVAEHGVSHYLAAIAAINFAFGVIVAAAMTLFSLPKPILWGTLAFALNFIPYLGPAIMAFLIFCAGLVTFHDLATPLLAAGTFVALNLCEGQFLTPSIVGRRTTMNPFLVFASLAFGLWFWGAIGAFLAMPVLLIIRAALRHRFDDIEDETNDTDHLTADSG